MPSRFVDALLAARLPVIMEVKRQDGNGVALMGERTIPEIVAEYVAAGAPCISVVTGRWFGGENEMLRETAGLTDLPLLQKDFITREVQIATAKELGASAILLTAQLLPKSALPKLIELTLGAGLTPFVEVIDEGELGRVTHAEDCVIAVNNKDIRNQERDAGDIDVSRAMLEAVLASGTSCPVSASAITDPRVGAELISAGYHCRLVSALSDKCLTASPHKSCAPSDISRTEI